MKVFCHIESDIAMCQMVMVEKEFVARPIIGDIVYLSNEFEKIKNNFSKSDLEKAKKIYYDYVYGDELSFDDAIIVKMIIFQENPITKEMELHIEIGKD